MNAPVAESPGALEPGTTLGRYQIVRELAMGGMAELYIGRHSEVAGYEKVVAIKRVLPNLARDESFLKMFLNEARLAAGLDHANIVHVIDFGSDGGEHFLAMEYVHGKGVHQIQRAAAKVGGVGLACALTIVRGVAAALHYAHERKSPDGRALGLVHRDVSPSNVLVSYDGEVKLTDFGIATATELTRVTRTGSIKGKLSYMAPEQVRGENIDRRADIFALGAILYELTTGQRCFYAPGEFALINRVVDGKYEPPTKVREDYPKELEAIVGRALEVDRDVRYDSAQELQVALEGFAADRGISLSSVALSELMNRLFGHEDYPVTSVIPIARPEPETLTTGHTVETTGARRRRKRRSASLLLATGAVGVFVGLGGGIAMSLGDDAPAPASPNPTEATPAAAVPTQPLTKPVTEDVTPPPEEEVIVIDEPESEPTPSVAATSPRRSPKVRKKKRPKKSDPPKESPDLTYLPPSQR